MGKTAFDMAWLTRHANHALQAQPHLQCSTPHPSPIDPPGCIDDIVRAVTVAKSLRCHYFIVYVTLEPKIMMTRVLKEARGTHFVISFLDAISS